MQAAASDTLTFTCPSCSAKLQVSIALAGQTGPCPMCSVEITAPRSTQPLPQPGFDTRLQQSTMPLETPAEAGLPSTSVPEPELPSHPQQHRVPVNPQPQPQRGYQPNGVALDSQNYVGTSPSPQAGQPAGLGVAMGLTHSSTAAAAGGGIVDPGATPQSQGSGIPLVHPTPALQYSRTKQPFPWLLAGLVVVLLGAIGYLLWKMGVIGGDGDSVGNTPSRAEIQAVLPAAPAATPAVAEPVALPEDAVAVTDPAPPITIIETPVPDPAAIVPEAPVQISDANNATSVITDTGVGSPEISTDPPTGILGPARQAIQEFLQAASWEERAAFVHNGDKLKAELKAYYADQNDPPVRDYRLDFFHSEQHESGGNMFVFFLTLPDEDGFPVIVREQEKEHFVDWELFTEFRDRKFEKFAAEKPSQPAAFRVVIQRISYHEADRDQIPDVDSLICYKIDPPYPGLTQYAFVPIESEAGKRLAEELSWESEPLAAEVMVHWDKFENGMPHLALDSVVRKSWSRP
ncbi:MAG: hypothetical protein ACI8UO_000887 [Verrucomicrobiales bacterium]|jgi:hypothetical protein